MASNNANQANNQSDQENAQKYYDKLNAFSNKISDLNVEELNRYVIRDANSKDNGKNTFIMECIQEYKELVAISKDSNGNFYNKDTQLSVFEMAAEKLGPAFWENFEVTETVVNNMVGKTNDLVNANADKKDVMSALNNTLKAIKCCPENLKKTYSEHFETLYTFVENQYGASAVEDADYETGFHADDEEKNAVKITAQDGSNVALSLPTETRFHIQMRVWERCIDKVKRNNGNFDDEDLDRVSKRYLEARSLAKDENGQPFDKPRLMKAFEESAFIFGDRFWKLGGAIPMSIPEKYVKELGEKMEKLNSGEQMSPEDEENLARFFRTTVRAVYSGEQKPSDETKQVLKGYYLTIQEKLRPEAAEKVYGSTSFDEVFPEYKDIAVATRERIKEKIKNEQSLEQERENDRKMILSHLCGAHATSDQVNSLLDEDLRATVFSDDERSSLIEMRDDVKAMGDCYLNEKVVNYPSIQSTFENIQTNYPGYFNSFKEKLQNAEPGSSAYKISLQALVYCGAILTATQQYVKARNESGLFPEDQGISVRNAAVSARKCLSVFKEAFQAFPQSGSSKIFSELKDSLDKAINGEGTLKDVLDKAKAYHEARKGIIFSPFTDVGKHRLDVAAKLIQFIGKLDVAALDVAMAQKIAEDDDIEVEENVVANVVANVNANVNENENVSVPVKETPSGDEYVKIEENDVDEENLIDNVEVHAPVKETPMVEKKEEVKSVAVMSMDDKVYELIKEKCKYLNNNGVVPRGVAGDIAEKAYYATYEQKEYLLNKFLNDDNKVKALVAEHPESKDLQKALDTILENVNKPVEENEFGMIDKQAEYRSLENQQEPENNEFNLLESENEFNLLDP